MAAQHIVAVVGSYRSGGNVDHAVDEVLAAAEAEGATTEKILLATRRISFCTNCRECTQAPGPKRGECPLDDDVDDILARIDAADALVLAAPVNYLDVTAVTRALLERMVAYSYWPWGEPAPQPRIREPRRRAVLVTSSAMPAWMGRLFTRALRTLKTMARSAGARPCGTLYLGLSAGTREAGLGAAARERARALGVRLVTGG